MATIETIILDNAISSVPGLTSKPNDYIESVQVWVISLTNIRVEPRKNAESASAGLNSILFKGGYISSQASQGQHRSWPFLWFSGNAKWTSYEDGSVSRTSEKIPGVGTVEEVMGKARALTNLAKKHEGEPVPYNINLALTGNLLTSLFPPDSKERTSCQIMAGAMPMLEARMRQLAANGEVQLHITVGMTSDTYAAASVKKMYKSSADLEDKHAFEVMLQERDILGLKWVIPGDKTFVPGLNLGQIVNITSEQYLPEKAEKEVLTPDEVLPKDANVIRFLNKNYGKFIKDNGSDHTLVTTREAFLKTLTGSFLKWAEIPEKKAKAMDVLAGWNPEGKSGPRVMGKPAATETPAPVVTSTPVPAVETLEKEVATPVVTLPTPQVEEQKVATPTRTSRMGSRLNTGAMSSIASSLASEFDED
jgi:hypothetical protein